MKRVTGLDAPTLRCGGTDPIGWADCPLPAPAVLILKGLPDAQAGGEGVSAVLAELNGAVAAICARGRLHQLLLQQRVQVADDGGAVQAGVLRQLALVAGAQLLDAVEQEKLVPRQADGGEGRVVIFRQRVGRSAVVDAVAGGMDRLNVCHRGRSFLRMDP